MDSSMPVNTTIIMVVVFAVITALFAIAIMAFVNPKLREKILSLLPFSGTGSGQNDGKGGGKNNSKGSEKKSLPIPFIILIIAGAMILAYFF